MKRIPYEDTPKARLENPVRWRGLIQTLDAPITFWGSNNDREIIKSFASHYKIPVRQVVAKLAAYRHSGNGTFN